MNSKDTNSIILFDFGVTIFALLCLGTFYYLIFGVDYSNHSPPPSTQEENIKRFTKAQKDNSFITAIKKQLAQMKGNINNTNDCNTNRWQYYQNAHYIYNFKQKYQQVSWKQLSNLMLDRATAIYNVTSHTPQTITEHSNDPKAPDKTYNLPDKVKTYTVDNRTDFSKNYNFRNVTHSDINQLYQESVNYYNGIPSNIHALWNNASNGIKDFPAVNFDLVPDDLYYHSDYYQYFKISPIDAFGYLVTKDNNCYLKLNKNS